ncbi:hypothetical protein P691DRAFT_726891 [Macrolepiota fuliginosa MF-IS2]|uniref:Uncharacterized protein n=1 Tax=Macrolepiota fuliginosa MF-IS2 TaxID=1400762 RepID=A0A9P6C2V3_9AGAR|nr:hypothetical protein P691DRAFT_726891 [Macrolepiota fuliginosa MF-IS2]
MASNPTRVFEHSYYIGNYLGGILYGLELFLYFLTLRKLRKHKAGSTRVRRFFAIYSTLALVLLTIDISCNAVWGEIMWIEGRELPEGVPQFIATEVSVWYQTLGSTSVVALIFMGDAFLLCRLFVIWGSNWLIMIIPILAYLAAFALAIIQLVVSGKPGGNFFGGKSINFGTPYYAITIGLNIVVTTLIYGRLVRLIGALNRSTESDKSLKFYTNAAAVFIESAALYSIVGIMFLVPYAAQSQTSIAFGQVWAKLTCICPQLIVLRMVSGHAWNRQRVTEAENSINGRLGSPRDNPAIDIENEQDSASRKSASLSRHDGV